MMNIKVSVIMCVYKEPKEMVRASITSLLSQTFKEYEIIIIDDYPDDCNLRKMLLDYMEENSCIRVLINEKNIGLTESLNKAIKAAKGEYICRMDADDIAFKDRLSIQYNFAEENQYKFVVSPVILIDENDKEIGNTKFITNLKYTMLVSILKNANILHHPTFFVKRNFLVKIGGYNNHFWVAQDYDLILRILKINVKIGITKKCTIKYRIWQSNITHKKETKQRYMLVVAQNENGKGYQLDEYENFSKAYQKFRIYKYSGFKLVKILPLILESISFRLYLYNTLLFKIKMKVFIREKCK